METIDKLKTMVIQTLTDHKAIGNTAGTQLDQFEVDIKPSDLNEKNAVTRNDGVYLYLKGSAPYKGGVKLIRYDFNPDVLAGKKGRAVKADNLSKFVMIPV
jgi:hypothetical protein